MYFALWHGKRLEQDHRLGRIRERRMGGPLERLSQEHRGVSRNRAEHLVVPNGSRRVEWIHLEGQWKVKIEGAGEFKAIQKDTYKLLLNGNRELSGHWLRQIEKGKRYRE